MHLRKYWKEDIMLKFSNRDENKPLLLLYR